MADIILINESTLTDRYQTTVPDAVRKALGLSKREKLRYTIKSDGSVLLSKAEQEESDPVLDSFLTFLAQDIQSHPQNLAAVSPNLAQHLHSLTEEVDIDLDAALEDEGDNA